MTGPGYLAGGFEYCPSCHSFTISGVMLQGPSHVSPTRADAALSPPSCMGSGTRANQPQRSGNPAMAVPQSAPRAGKLTTVARALPTEYQSRSTWAGGGVREAPRGSETAGAQADRMSQHPRRTLVSRLTLIFFALERTRLYPRERARAIRSRARGAAWWLPVVILVATGCGFFASEPERQWYKPGGRYTVEEFQRDKTSCTKSRRVDVECMKAKGWFYFSADAPPEPSLSPQLKSTAPSPTKRQ